MLIKKTEELKKALNEVTELITNYETHVKRLLESCVSVEQVEKLHPYVDQLCYNIEQISTHYKPHLWWRKMYQKEVQFRLFLSASNMHMLINKKYRYYQKD